MSFFLKSKNKFKLYISPYKIHFKNKRKAPLEGSLLAFDFGWAGMGYSDFLPWPAFQELSLFQQLADMRKGRFSQRFLIARRGAWMDAQARAQQRNLLFGLKIPPSHYLIEDILIFKSEEEIAAKGFKAVKVKLKPYKEAAQAEKLKAFHSHLRGVKWRLDLNGQSWPAWRRRLDFIREGLDFVEDPLLNPRDMEKPDRKILAQDWTPSPYFQIKIVKPSRDALWDLLKELAFFRWKRLIFTHSFDHPLGQAMAAFYAGVFYKNSPRFFETGALTHSLFKVRSYPVEEGPDFAPPAGFGFGFSDSLKREKWKRWL